MTKRPNSGNQQARYIVASRWIIRLAAFALVICLCSAAVFILIGQWQAVQLNSLPEYEGINSDLNPVQKFYLGIALASRSEELSQPIGLGAEEVLFDISFGETAEQIAANLNDADLLNDTDLFLNYLRYYGLDSFLEAGSFHIDPRITYPELAERLTNATIEEIELRFIEGWRLEEMANYLTAVKPAEIDPDEFLNIVINLFFQIDLF